MKSLKKQPLNPRIKERLMNLISFESVNILACDVSYRHTGICILNKKKDSICIEKATTLDNPELSYGFEGYQDAARNMNNIARTIIITQESFKCDLLVCEMPTYGRSMNAGMAIGICWGSMQQLNPLFISPQHLKAWSISKKGDGKSKVLAMVKDRVHLDSYANDNVVDAVGTAIMVSDWITLLRYETHQ